MTDLSQLFLSHKPPPSPQFLTRAFASQQQSTVKNLFSTRSNLNPQLQPKFTYESSSLLTSPLRRSQKQLCKMTMNSQGMTEEIQYFKKLYFKQFAQKAMLLLIPILALHIFGLMNGKICFQSMLFGLSLLALEAQIIENTSLKHFINTLPFLTYLALFYDILTLNDFAGNYNVTLANVPAFLISFVATINFLIFRKISFMPNQQIKTNSTGTQWKQMLNNFTKNYIIRLKSILKLIKYSISLNVILLLVFVAYCMINLKTSLFSSTLSTIPFGVLVYALVDYLAFSVEFVSRQIQLFNLKKKFYQIDVCIGLLRMKNSDKNDEYQKIQQRCLVELARQLKKNRDYLETSVKVNYAINSYRDIFEFYSIEDFNNLLSILTEITVKISKNNKAIESKKSFKQDMFILIKKIMARIDNNYQLYRFLAELQKRQLVFIILAKLASEEPIKNRVLDVVEQIISKVKKSFDGKSLLEVSQIKLQSWADELQNLKKTLQESSTKSTSHLTERDVEGWYDQITENPADILEN